MKILLVNPPNNLFDVQDLGPPLGLLSLAAALNQEDVDIELLDFNLMGISNPRFVEENFYSKAIKLIEEKSPDLIGLTSMAVNSHVALELGRQLKLEFPSLTLILGGTHFSAIAEEVLHYYPWIDYVIRGEGELAFRDLFRVIKSRNRVTPINAPYNVAFRDGDHVVSSHINKPLENLDHLPFPAYQLVNVDDYFKLNPRRVLDYEPGRGCIFKCSFCYSPVHYGQGGQAKTIERILSDMHRLQELGASHLFFVQDNFVNDVRLTRELCRAIAEAKFNLTWNCYTTLPQLNEEMIKLLSEAGCRQIFTGVDAINESYQKEFLKRFYKGWDPLEKVLKNCAEYNIVPTCAFMVEDPTKGTHLTDKTLMTALFARCNGAGLRLNTLTLYNATASDILYKDRPVVYSELKPRLLLDCPEIVYSNDYAKKNPKLFPFHNTCLPPDTWQKFTAGMHIAFTLFKSFPMTVFYYATEDQQSLWGLMDCLADEMKDIEQIPARIRRSRERAAFSKWFKEQRNLSNITRQAFELESAELSVSLPSKPNLLKVKVDLDEYERDIAVHKYELATLSYEIPDLHRFNLLTTPDDGTPERVLLTYNGKYIEYYKVRESVFEALLELRKKGSEATYIDGSILEALKSVGILSEVSTRA